MRKINLYYKKNVSLAFFYFSLVESTAHFIKGCLGAGILGIHEAYMYGGIWTSLLVTIIFGFLNSHCMSVSSSQTLL